MSQIDLFENAGSTSAIDIPIDKGRVVFYPQFYQKSRADELFSGLLTSTNWKQEFINMYGKELPFPRLTAWYGDIISTYNFSGDKFSPNAWTPLLLNIKKEMEELTVSPFNSVLLNLYRNGNDSVSWHSDDEPELGINPVIASVNLGETRRFGLRKIDKHPEKLEINLEHGSVLLMAGELQHYWEHHVPKTKKLLQPRINLTFRYIHQKG